MSIDHVEEARRKARIRLADIEKELTETAALYRHKLAQGEPEEELQKLVRKYSELKAESERMRLELTKPESRFKSKKR
jgi:hypothetical protein